MSLRCWNFVFKETKETKEKDGLHILHPAIPLPVEELFPYVNLGDIYISKDAKHEWAITSKIICRDRFDDFIYTLWYLPSMTKIEETEYRNYHGNSQEGTILLFSSKLESSFGLSIVEKICSDNGSESVEREILLSSDSRAAIISQLADGSLDNKDLLGIILDYLFPPTLSFDGTVINFPGQKFQCWCANKK